MKVRFHNATKPGQCYYCRVPYDEGERIVRITADRPAHGPCAIRHLRNKRARLNGAIHQIKNAFGLKRCVTKQAPEVR